MATTFYTYAPGKAPAGQKANELTLKAGEKLGYSAGKGYYAIPAPPTTGLESGAGKSKQSGSSPGTFQNPPGTSAPTGGGTPTTSTPPGPTDTGGSGGGGTNSPSSGFDWQAYLTNWGFPPDVVAQLDTIFRTYSDPSQASAAALAYIRGTDWYAQTFPGIQAGIKNGLISDESGYRAYTNDLNQVYQRYYGRNATASDISNGLTGGQSANQIGAHFGGQAYIAANQGDIQYELGAFDTQGRATTEQLGALGDQTAGLDNALGPEIQRRVNLAQQKMQRIFQGSLGTPALSMLKGSAIQGTSLNPQANAPDVAA